ncbi:hypothetical protein [Aquimarina agarilytica]|uniref:hypothetical protein n=1 Tax=Aquimarina agarilytica TaxID=1087449 RepID=UPI000288678B|nr:hypothetical protein [Aquimarina agarilytica]
MINRKYYIIFIPLIFFGTFFLKAQNKEQSNLILGYAEVQELSFHIYEPRLKVKATISNLNEVKNKYPEQLMQSILSASNQKWVNYNTLNGEKDKQEQSHFDRIKSMDKNKNYFELHHKLTFNLGDIPTSIIKFFFYQENEEPLSASYVMQKVEGRWQRTSHVSLSTLSIIVMRMKSEILEGIILGSSDDPNIVSIRDRVTINESLDLKKLEQEFVSWYDPVIDQKKINLYKDPMTW